MAKDYAYTEDYDLVIEDGDFKVIESTHQHQTDLLLMCSGEQRMYPYVGVGLINYVNDDQFGGLNKEIREKFELDGQIVDSVVLYEDGKADIKAHYPN
jgi:hypothetical protein